MIDGEVRELVRKRANNRCEYCLRQQAHHSDLTHHAEHIVAKSHGGSDDLGNLALSCQRCNLRKGPNLTGIDPVTRQATSLFHPRRDQWDEHFRVDGFCLEGITATGRATTQVLGMKTRGGWNCGENYSLRENSHELGVYSLCVIAAAGA